LGREVAPREIAATIAGALCARAGLTIEQSRIMVACGAGAGLAAVYNVPLAGTLYVLEGLLFAFGWRASVPAVATSAIAALVARSGLGNLPQYAVPHYVATPSLMIWAALAGPLIGLLAYGFTRLTDSARTHAPRDWQLPVLCLMNFVFVGLVAIHFPQLLGNGKGPAQVGFDGSLTIRLAAILLTLRVLFTWTSLRAGAEGGLLTPGLCNGALLAIVLGGAWSLLWPGTPLGAFAVIGAAAFLATSMRVPLTAVALIFEFTQPTQEFLVPVLIAVTGSVAASECARRLVDARCKAISESSAASPAKV
jgi:H+/Cl- antiporter ClcA